jgi:hypothetical protein
MQYAVISAKVEIAVLGYIAVTFCSQSLLSLLPNQNARNLKYHVLRTLAFARLVFME